MKSGGTHTSFLGEVNGAMSFETAGFKEGS